jgi:1-acyl-sn-glycerol-3-phosphate acyltransferase
MIYTTYMWLIGAVTLVPLWGLLLILPPGKTAASAIGAWARLLLALGGCPLRVRRADHLERAAPAVVVVNHSSYLDAVAIMAALRVPFRFVVNHRAAGWPLVGLAIRKAGHIVVDRGRLADRHACALTMVETLRQGVSVVVFPEGTIGRSGRLLPFHRGPFRVAADAGRPVVPNVLSGTRHVLESSLRRLRRGPIVVAIGAPLRATGADRQDVDLLRDRTRQHVASGLDEAHQV